MKLNTALDLNEQLKLFENDAAAKEGYEQWLSEFNEEQREELRSETVLQTTDIDILNQIHHDLISNRVIPAYFKVQSAEITSYGQTFVSCYDRNLHETHEMVLGPKYEVLYHKLS